MKTLMLIEGWVYWLETALWHLNSLLQQVMADRQTDTKPLPIMLTAQNNEIRWLCLYGKKS